MVQSLTLLHMSKDHLELPGAPLRSKALQVDFDSISNAELQAIIRGLFAAMYSEPGGVGLAAPMVGINLRIIIADPGDRSPLVLVNPRIVAQSSDLSEMYEANLCLPYIRARVRRTSSIDVCWQDLDGRVMQESVDGLLARIIHHESEILDGRIYLDHLPPMSLERTTPENWADSALTHAQAGLSIRSSVPRGEPIMHFFSPVTLSPELLGLAQTVLRQRAQPVLFAEWEQERLLSLIKEMFWLQHHLEGVGLAAPQVGFSLQLAVIDNRQDPPLVLINPITVWKSPETESAREGCLSLPGYAADVERPVSVSIQAMDAHGKQFELTASGYLARIIQHEIDHLDGRLYPDHLRSDDQLMKVDADTLADTAMREILRVDSSVA